MSAHKPPEGTFDKRSYHVHHMTLPPLPPSSLTITQTPHNQAVAAFPYLQLRQYVSIDVDVQIRCSD